MKNRVHSFARLCKDILPVLRPVKIILTLELIEDDWDAYQMLDAYGNHIIGISKMSSRDIKELIAHEMVHAFIDENYPKAAVHGKRFQKAAKRLERELETHGYFVPDIYIQGVDV